MLACSDIQVNTTYDWFPNLQKNECIPMLTLEQAFIVSHIKLDIVESEQIFLWPQHRGFLFPSLLVVIRHDQSALAKLSTSVWT